MIYDLKCHFNAETEPIVLVLSKYNLHQIIVIWNKFYFNLHKNMIMDNSALYTMCISKYLKKYECTHIKI